MIRMKIGGMILTGFAAYLVAGKAVHAVNSAVANACEASKWKGYYKCWSRGKTQGEPVAPGYSRTTRPDNADYEIVDDPKGNNHAHDIQTEGSGNANPEAAVNAVCEAVKTAADKAIDTLFKGSKAAEGAKEGQTEASVDADDICQRDCYLCIAEDSCPYKDMKLDGIITKWGEDGKPIAGRYPWGREEGTECHWEIRQKEQEDAEDLKPWHIDIRVNDEGEGEIHECDEKEDDAEENDDETVD